MEMFGDVVPRSWVRDRAFFRELPDLLEEVFGPVRHVEERGSQWSPAIEGHVKDGTLVVRADLPGVDPQHVDVSLDGTQLRIAGERKVEEQKDANGARYSEVRYGRFERILTVPEGLDPEKVTARYANGVLEVTAPLRPERTARKVPIQTADPTPEAGAKRAA
jgi:HSP20 family protein